MKDTMCLTSTAMDSPWPRRRRAVMKNSHACRLARAPAPVRGDEELPCPSADPGRRRYGMVMKNSHACRPALGAGAAALCEELPRLQAGPRCRRHGTVMKNADDQDEQGRAPVCGSVSG